jgi:hypothetical protein
MWRHVGGGCFLGAGPPQSFCCDDEYQDETGRRAVFHTTVRAHFRMPDRVESLSGLKRQSGVRLVEMRPKPKKRRQA